MTKFNVNFIILIFFVTYPLAVLAEKNEKEILELTQKAKEENPAMFAEFLNECLDKSICSQDELGNIFAPDVDKPIGKIKDMRKSEFTEIAGGGAKQLGGANPHHTPLANAVCGDYICERQKMIDACLENKKIQQLCTNYMNGEAQKGRPVTSDEMEGSSLYQLKKFFKF